MESIINATIIVASNFNCDNLEMYEGKVNKFSSIWKQTVAGCAVFEILKYMYGFNVSYVLDCEIVNITGIVGEVKMACPHGNSIDLYIRPKIFSLEDLEFVYPIYAAYEWRFGVTLRHSDHSSSMTFFSKPFSRPAWNCLYGMAVFVSILFYITKRWETATVGASECSYAYEVLTVIGAYCQHIPPIEAKMISRRIAYFVFLIFAYIIYTYYTSNLLSNLVNDKDQAMTLANLAATKLNIVIVDYLAVSQAVPSYVSNYSSVINKLLELKSVSITEGLEGVRTGKMALVSEYTTLFPFIKRSFTSREICETSTIDVFKDIKKYMFTSKQFIYKEQFKVGALRAKETGILGKVISNNYKLPECQTNDTNRIVFLQISIPVMILFATYVLCLFILLVERIYYKRHKVWPYVE